MSGETGSMVVGEKKNKSKTTTQISFGTENVFPVYPTDLIAHNINLVALAQDAGKKNLPSSNQSSRYGTDEEKIDVAIDDIAKQYHFKACSIIEALDKLFNSDESDTQRIIDETRLFPSKFESEVDQYRVSTEVEYQLAKKVYMERCKEYEEFREKHHLNRPAEIVTSSKKFFLFALLLIFILGEALFNVNFFAANDENGILGGITTAAIASAMNVIPTAILGCIGIRYINRSDRAWIGWLSLIVAISISILVAWYVGHWRDGWPEGWTVFEFNSRESYVLFFVTLILGGLSMRDGYSFEDPCPGYPEKEKQYYEACDYWASVVDERRKNFANIERNITQQIRDNLASCSNGLRSMRSSVMEKKNVLVAYENALRSLEKSYHALISRYRTENEKSRTDTPPVYFQQEVIFDLSRLPSIQTHSEEFEKNRVSMLEDRVNELRKEAKDIQEQIHKTFNSFEDQLKIKEDTI